MKLYTHTDVDLDAACSVWAARTFIQGVSEAELVFVSARWDGSDLLPNDIAIDVTAGGRGWKGKTDEYGRVHSCFKYIIDNFALTEDKDALKYLVAFVDMQDSRGDAFRNLFPNMGREDRVFVFSISMQAFFFAVKTTCRGEDALVVNMFSDILSGYLRSRSRSISDFDINEFLQTVEFFGNGMVAVTIEAPFGFSSSHLFQRGVVVRIYKSGNNIGVRRRNSANVRMDHPLIRAVIEKAGEEIGDEDGKWYAHPSGFLFSWGTRKGQASTPSKVDVRELAEAVAQVILSVPKEELGIDEDSEET